MGMIVLLLPLGGCPQQIEKMVEEMIPPKDYKPIYMTSSIPLSRIIEGRRHAAESGATPGPADSAALAPLAMELRTVDDRRYPDEIELRATVTDTSGRFVMGLAPPYFSGTGNYRNYWKSLVDSCSGKAVPIDSFSVTEVRQDRREPYAISFVLDHSPSMGDLRARKLQEALRRVLRIIKAGDMVSVVKFTREIYVEVPLTADSAVYKSQFRVDGLEGYGGGTSIYDASIAAVHLVSKAPAGYRKAIIVFTDGGDNTSRFTIDSAHRAARENNTSIYTVAYGMADTVPMHNLAAYTGGRMYRIYSNKEFPYVFADIYRSLSSYYRITYRPPECDGMHTVKVGLAIPDLDNLQLAARGTYDRSIFTPFHDVGDIALVNIEFDYDRATIRPESMPRIREVADVLNSYPSMGLEIRGHTDDRGTDEYNQRLSEERAQAVADALEDMGIKSARLTVKGFGESKPLVPNDSEENRRKNRRTEFVVVHK
jgi:VWFA-related protein